MRKHKLSEVCEINPPKAVNMPDHALISFVPMDSVSTDGHIELKKTIEVNRVKNYTVFQNGDVLFAKITPCMENGKGAITNSLLNGYGAGSTEFIVLRPNAERVTAQWIYLFLSQTLFRLQCQQHMTGSAGQKRVPPKYLASCEIPVPSLPEQERIVARIEELFSQLDAGVETLKKTKAQLAVYRQAVLKEALYAGDMFRIRECIEEMGQGWSPKCERVSTTSDDEWAVITTTAIQPMGFHFEENKRLPDSLLPREKHVIEVGDLLITRAGPRSRCGICCLVRETKKRLLNCDKVYRMRVKKDFILPEYLELILNSPAFIKEIAFCKTGGNDSGVNLTQDRFLDIEVPVPSIDVQMNTISEIESRLSICDSIEKTVDTALRQAEAMRQSILKRAFEGGL